MDVSASVIIVESDRFVMPPNRSISLPPVIVLPETFRILFVAAVPVSPFICPAVTYSSDSLFILILALVTSVKPPSIWKFVFSVELVLSKLPENQLILPLAVSPCVPSVVVFPMTSCTSLLLFGVNWNDFAARSSIMTSSVAPSTENVTPSATVTVLPATTNREVVLTLAPASKLMSPLVVMPLFTF